MSAIHKATGGYLFRTVGGATKYLHVKAAEKALGKPLPPGAEVHHINGNPADNAKKTSLFAKTTNITLCST